ncbi:hypothetical protein [Streptomyces sp. NBC_01565]|uniref:hypothetical protein n=1 Tax=unclassified Streptomyces TaxID=2593676 RepID=UPI0022556626|nr:hypothetical protein [Streptomyces sp. NBC_01565]MCX4546781.1 hypothetical protein [Streptomyces sp. NBC_01565]
MHPIRLTSFGYLPSPTGPDSFPVPRAADPIEDIRDRHPSEQGWDTQSSAPGR